PGLGPLRRFMGAIEHCVLAEGKGEVPAERAQAKRKGEPGSDTLPHAPCSLRGEGRLIVFLDEIDVVRSLPFNTDAFFAAIRECYNRRSRDPEFQRLTFCLLGVASPSDLIRDTRLTPFNIGRRIELTDFTEAEA